MLPILSVIALCKDSDPLFVSFESKVFELLSWAQVENLMVKDLSTLKKKIERLKCFTV